MPNKGATLDVFLKHILPSSGLYALATIKKQSVGKAKVTHHWCRSIEELEELGTQDFGADTYVACASYSERKRTQANVALVRSVWGDIDLKNSRYNNLKEAMTHVHQFCDFFGVPRPLFVFSGGGWHIYWRLDRDVTANEWLALATKFQAAATHFGLELDVKCTRDSARIMRLPRTKNYKYADDRYAICSTLIPDEISTSVFDAFDGVEQPKQKVRTHTAKPARDISRVTQSMLGGTNDADADFIADNCAQLSHFRATGSDTEPHWYACANILKYCTDGAEKFLEWSANYDGFDLAEAQNKFTHAIASNSGPTLCKSFGALNAKACVACRQNTKVTTPLNVRISPSMGDETETPVDGGGIEVGSIRASDGEEKEEELPEVHQPFSLYKGSIWGTTENASAKTKNGLDVMVTSCDIRLIRKINIGGSKQSLVFAAKDYLEKTYREIIIPANEAWGSQALGAFATRGVYIYDMTMWRKYVQVHMAHLDREKMAEIAYDSFGWQDDGSFILGPWKYSNGEREPITLAPSIKERGKTIGTVPGGSVEGAVIALDRAWAQMSSGQKLLYCLAIGSPLIKFCNIEEGGFAGWNFSHESGTGKSTLITLIETAVGRPNCIRVNERDTWNAKAAMFGIMGNIPITMDDPTLGDGEGIRSMIDHAVMGTDKQSMTQGRELRELPKKWRTSLIVGSNFNPFDIIESQRKRRIIGVHEQVKPYMDRTQWADIYEELKANGGWLFHMFIRALTKKGNLEKAIDRVNELRKYFDSKFSFRTEDRFVVAAMAVAFTALEFIEQVAKACGNSIVVDKNGMVESAVKSAKESMFHADKNDGGTAIELLMEFLHEYSPNTAVVHQENRGMAPVLTAQQQGRPLSIIIREKKNLAVVHQATFHKWLKMKKRSAAEVYDELLTKGVGKSNKTVVNMSLPGCGQAGNQRVYIFDLSYLLAVNDD